MRWIAPRSSVTLVPGQMLGQSDCRAQVQSRCSPNTNFGYGWRAAFEAGINVDPAPRRMTIPYIVPIPSRPGREISYTRAIKDPDWPVVEIDLAMFFKDWPKLAPAYQANVKPIIEWSEDKIVAIQNFLLNQGHVPMPRLQSANLVRFPFWDYRRYMRHRFTTVTFVDGRHRMIWMHQNGVLRAPVQIKSEYMATLSKSYCGRRLPSC